MEENRAAVSENVCACTVHMATVHWLPQWCDVHALWVQHITVMCSSVTVTASGRSTEETTRGGCIGEHTGDQDART